VRLPVAKDGLPIILAGVVITALVVLVSTSIAMLCGFFTVFSVFFFRDPERSISSEPGLILSPADGTIVDVAEVDEPHVIKGPARRVSIFMSIFNVHVNRIPFSGTVVYRQYNPGAFAIAWRDKASELNEQLSVGVDTGSFKYVVRQIAGYVARRIVCRVEPEQAVDVGVRMGLIRFGSRVDLFLPCDGIRVEVAVGDKVSGGTSVIARVEVND